MLHLKVDNAEGAYDSYDNNFTKIFFQTYASAKGEKIPPMLNDKIGERLNKDGSTYSVLFGSINFLWICE